MNEICFQATICGFIGVFEVFLFWQCERAWQRHWHGVGFSRQGWCESHGQKGAKVKNREVVAAPLANGHHERNEGVDPGYAGVVRLLTRAAPIHILIT